MEDKLKEIDAKFQAFQKDLMDNYGFKVVPQLTLGLQPVLNPEVTEDKAE